MEILVYNKTYIFPNVILGKKKGYSLTGEICGRGGNALVLEGEDILTGDNVAIKVLWNNKPKRSERFIQEIKILKNITSTSIIKYLDDGEMEIDYPHSNNKKKTKHLFLVTELGSENLFDYIKHTTHINYEIYSGHFLELAKGLKELHSKHIIHRDIKPENILIVGTSWVLADLGLCSYDDDTVEDITTEKEIIGPRYWMSPEAINRLVDTSISHEFASDIFQLAAVFWFVLNRKIPFGIVSSDDWINDDKKFQDLILKSLLHAHSKRPQNGSYFLEEIEAIIGLKNDM